MAYEYQEILDSIQEICDDIEIKTKIMNKAEARILKKLGVS